MRCKACNKLLSDREAARKEHWGAYVDLCNGCYTPSNQAVIEGLDNDYLKGNITFNNKRKTKGGTRS